MYEERQNRLQTRMPIDQPEDVNSDQEARILTVKAIVNCWIVSKVNGRDRMALFTHRHGP